MEFSCILCSATKAAPWLMSCSDYFLSLGQPVDYFRCNACGLIQQYPLPRQVATLYADYPVHARKSRLHEVVRRIILKPVYFDSAQLAKGTCLLDYGCGDGWYLDSLRGCGLNLLGYEPDASHAAALEQGLNIPVYRDLAKLQAEQQGRIGIITMHYVLEHLTDIHGCFALLNRLLVPGGLLYCVVPNIHSWEARLFGALWHGLDAPRHISFPDEPAICRLAEKHAFELITTKTVPFPNTSAASLAVWLAGRYRPTLFLALLPLGLLASRVRPTGTLAFLLKRTD